VIHVLCAVLTGDVMFCVGWWQSWQGYWQG